MKQAVLKIKKISRTKVLNDTVFLQHIFQTVLFSLLALAILYLFLLGSMVFNIVERKSVESHAYVLSNEVSDMELEYLALSKKIDMAYAKSVGFQETKTNFATRKTFGSISLSKNEI